jgi:hypothetical protein
VPGILAWSQLTIPERALQTLETGEKLFRQLEGPGVLVQGMAGISLLVRLENFHIKLLAKLSTSSAVLKTSLAHLSEIPRVAPTLSDTFDYEFYFIWAYDDYRDNVGKAIFEDKKASQLDRRILARWFLAYRPVLAGPASADQRRQLEALKTRFALVHGDDPKLLENLADYPQNCSLVAAQADLWRQSLLVQTALYGYRAEHGHFPESLQALLAEWLPVLPTDSRNQGATLVYKKQEENFVLSARSLNLEEGEGMAIDTKNWHEPGPLLLHR